jgi:formate dehydrogenase iron-sulfur subunit
MSAVKIYVPCDSAALAVGADEVAAALRAECARRGWAIELVRNGSRGLFWLETLVEVATPSGRVAYGPVTAEDVPGLLDAGLLQGGEHALRHGITEQIPFLALQERLTFRRMGITDPLSLADYEAHDGWAGLKRAIGLDAPGIVAEVTHSGLRGRGGAAFPAGIKWKTVAGTAAAQKYVVCNADEGDSGTYSDRMTMEGDPYMLIEGMTIAALAVGATMGYIYIRSEYPHAVATMSEAIARAKAAGFLGERQDVCARSAQGGRFLRLRRRDRHAREPGRQTRHRARQASAAGHRRFVRQADRNQQRDHARQRAGDPGARRAVLPRLRRRPFARHFAISTGR